ncbi:MAG: ATP-dependent helicase [Thermoplasmata archaeon]|nr:ATP-dependent helicase [Thermoplasmata archaeon]
MCKLLWRYLFKPRNQETEISKKFEYNWNQIQKNEKNEIEKYSDFLKDLGNNYEQKRTVVSEFNRILVLAGAGSGKTKVLTKRFIHLVKNKNVPIHDILAVTFTREARNEMVKRISKSLDKDEELVKRYVRTFHSFALSILKQNEEFDIISESKQRDIIIGILEDLQVNEEISNSINRYITENVIDVVKDQDNKSGREYQIKPKPDDLCFGKNNIKTNAGIPVRSKSERDLANYLTFLGLKWEYEQELTWADNPFKPDFTIEDEFYLEHWCYNENTPEFNQINKKKYLENRRWKENQYKKHNKILFSTEEIEMKDLLKLQLRMKKELELVLGKKLPLCHQSDLPKISLQYSKANEHFIDEIIEIINLAKSRFFTVEDIKEKIKNQQKEKVIDFYNVLIPVMEKYNEYLKRKDLGKKDFNDLIQNAVQLLRTNQLRREYYQSRIKYLLVDEFQDVSYGEIELLRQILTNNTRFFVVGDDWQSIYGWRGAEVNYILDFETNFGVTEKIILPINYRSTKSIISASSHFIQLKGRQIKKDIRCSDEQLLDNTKIIQLNARDDFDGARYVVNKIRKLMNEDSSLKLSDFLILIRSSRVAQGYKTVFKENNLNIDLKTIHWSKGTEFQYVFVLGLKSGLYGFPNVYADREIKRIILDIPIEEKEAEERRLFYVAMTRAKKKLFLISEENNPSEFLSDVPQQYVFVIPNENN